MKERSTLTRVLAITGTVLVWFPILFPLVITAAEAAARRPHINFDWLLPAEMFPLVFLGGGLLLWAALRARMYVRLIAWALGAAFVILFGGQALAVITGIASGATEMTTGRWVLLGVTIGLYTLAVIALGVFGIRLTRRLFPPRAAAAPA